MEDLFSSDSADEQIFTGTFSIFKPFQLLPPLSLSCHHILLPLDSVHSLLWHFFPSQLLDSTESSADCVHFNDWVSQSVGMGKTVDLGAESVGGLCRFPPSPESRCFSGNKGDLSWVSFFNVAGSSERKASNRVGVLDLVLHGWSYV